MEMEELRKTLFFSDMPGKPAAPKIDIAQVQQIQAELQAAVAELQGLNKGKVVTPL